MSFKKQEYIRRIHSFRDFIFAPFSSANSSAMISRIACTGHAPKAHTDGDTDDDDDEFGKCAVCLVVSGVHMYNFV